MNSFFTHVEAPSKLRQLGTQCSIAHVNFQELYELYTMLDKVAFIHILSFISCKELWLSYYRTARALINWSYSLAITQRQSTWILLTSPAKAQMHCTHKVHDVQCQINRDDNKVRAAKFYGLVMSFSTIYRQQVKHPKRLPMLEQFKERCVAYMILRGHRCG